MKLVKSIHQKKYRDQQGLFLVEGVKLVNEAIQSDAKLEMIAYAGEVDDLPFNLPYNSFRISEKDLGRISALKTPNKVLAVCKKKHIPEIKTIGWSVVLDQISDPGNLGTIIRICDWMGVKQIICDNDSVDVYNPKVVQASMGSIFRVNVVYVDLVQFLSESTEKVILAADMNGESIYDFSTPDEGLLVMGSESHGLRKQILDKCSSKISIPKLGQGESLNVAVSTGIVLSHLMR